MSSSGESASSSTATGRAISALMAAGDPLALRAVGLIDADGRPTDLAHAWRSDEEYAEAAHQMLEAIYPPQLRDALPPPSPDKDAVERWFMRNTGVGGGAARKMGTLYRLICEADPTAQDRAPATEERPARRAARAGGEDGQGRASGRRAQARPRVQAQTRRESAEPSPTPELPAPGLHIDVQVHIPTDASADQIDRIFESMARHLYGRRS